MERYSERSKLSQPVDRLTNLDGRGQSGEESTSNKKATGDPVVPAIDHRDTVESDDGISEAEAGSISRGSSACKNIIDEAEELLEEVCFVTINAGKIASEEVREGLELLTAPEEDAKFGGGDVVAAVLTLVTFNIDLISDLLLARHLSQGDDVDRRWAVATFCMTVVPLVVVNGFSLYWYWFDSHPHTKTIVAALPLENVDECDKRFAADEDASDATSESPPSATSNNDRYEKENNISVGMNKNERTISRDNSLGTLNDPAANTSDELNCFNRNANIVAKSPSSSLKSHGACIKNEEEIIDAKNEISFPHQNRVKLTMVWCLRFLFHFTMQANSLRQLDLLYYGTRSVATVRQKHNTHNARAFFKPKSLDGDRYESKRSAAYSTRPPDVREGFEVPDSLVKEKKRFQELWLHAESDGAALDLIGAVLQDVPQIILQLYLLALSVPLLSASVMQYNRFLQGFRIDSWLFEKIFSEVISTNSSNLTSLMGYDVEFHVENIVDGNLALPGTQSQRNIYEEAAGNFNYSDLMSLNYSSSEFAKAVLLNNSEASVATFVLRLTAPKELLPDTEQHLVALQLLCLCGSLCAVSWSATSWVRAVRLASLRLTSLSPASLLILTLAHLTAIVPQVMCYAALATTSPELLLLVLLLLWALHTTWILSQLVKWSQSRRQLLEWFPHDIRTGLCRRADDVCLSAALALVFLLTFLDVAGDESGAMAAAHAALRLAVQLAVASAWYVSTGGVQWVQQGPLWFVLTAGALHAALTAAHYHLTRWAHATHFPPKKQTLDDTRYEDELRGAGEEQPPETSRTEVV
ncbi:uncharacterized protein LOC108671544 [Hyalella azteca]|uniref:XK-related protein n=1 Tax=Hyalella azteca TaxID=294128 RepID=A0A8B7NLP4_HYAAZ|nr:uncharacterized protein LOC108671544 [Hyalella azteca]